MIRRMVPGFKVGKYDEKMRRSEDKEMRLVETVLPNLYIELRKLGSIALFSGSSRKQNH